MADHSWQYFAILGMTLITHNETERFRNTCLAPLKNYLANLDIICCVSFEEKGAKDNKIYHPFHHLKAIFYLMINEVKNLKISSLILDSYLLFLSAVIG